MASKLEVLLKLKDAFTKPLNKSEGVFKRFKKNISSGWRSIATLPNLVAGAAVTAVAKQFFDAAMEVEALEAKMKAAVPTFGASQRELAFVTEESNRMGLNLRVAAGEYANFAAAATRSSISLKDTREIFKNISEAAVSLKLPANRLSLVFTALSQMASKGVVSMEELRRQLADSLPGAVQIAARSMDMTQAAFQKAISSGEIMAVDFLPKFAKQIRKELGGGFDDASQQMQASLNRMKNAWFQFRAGIGTAFLGDAQSGVDGVANSLNTLNENLNSILFTVKTLITPLVILGNAFQIAGDAAAAFSVVAFKKFKQTSLKDKLLTALGGPFAERVVLKQWIKDPKKLLQEQEEVKSIWDKLFNETDKNIKDIADHYASVQMAWYKAQEKMKPISTKMIGGETGDGGAPGVNQKELEKQQKEWEKNFNKISRYGDLELQMVSDYTKKIAEEKKNINEQILESEYFFAQARVDTMADGIQKEIALLDLKYKKIREGHENNAVALKNIDDAYALERKAIVKSTTQNQIEEGKRSLQSTVYMLQEAASQWKEFAGIYKAIAIAETIWDTYSSAQAAYKSLAHIKYVGPVLGAAAAAAATVAGLARVERIRQTKFATGVRSFRTSGPQTIMVGDNPGGVEDVSVRPVSSENVSGPTGGDMRPINIYLSDYTGGLVEKLRSYVRSNDADRLIRDILARGAAI